MNLQMKNRNILALPFLALIVFCPAAAPQAATEYGLGAGNAATAATPARNLAKGIGGVFESLNKAVDRNAEATASEPPAATDPAQGPSARAASRSRQSRRQVASKAGAADATPAARAQPATVAPPPAFEDPRQIQAGLAYDEMLRRFGPPSMSITSESGRRTVWYSNGDHKYQVEVENGKVIAPAPPAP